MLVVAGRRQNRSRRVLAAAVILYILVFAGTVAYNPWLGRLLIPAVALAAPLFAVLAKRPAIAGATLVLAILSLACLHCWRMSRSPAREFGSPEHLRPRPADTDDAHPDRDARGLNALDAYVGGREAIAFVGGEDSWDYPFFGAHRSRGSSDMTIPQRSPMPCSAATT